METLLQKPKTPGERAEYIIKLIDETLGDTFEPVPAEVSDETARQAVIWEPTTSLQKAIFRRLEHN